MKFLIDQYAATKTNIRGKKLKGKYLVIESDDWGAIRMPSKETLKKFEKKGFKLSESVYKNDALESNEDLNRLFDLLISIKDVNGNPLKLTANTIMANPDFEKIKLSNFKQYYFESFIETYKKYPKHSDSFSILKNGISSGVFMPQFHGREHLNINRWLKALQNGDDKATFCFNQNSTYSGEADYSFMEALDWDNPDDVLIHNTINKEGLEIFQKTFGFKSKSFIAPCYNWDPKTEQTLSECGVEIIQGLRSQLAPTGKFNQYSPIPHIFGEKNQYGIKYNIRNVFFEPSSNKNKDWVDSSMNRIFNAFLFNKPAVISTHRINYIGFIDSKNSERGLNLLKTLMKKVIQKWPDVQFISTDQLTELL